MIIRFVLQGFFIGIGLMLCVLFYVLLDHTISDVRYWKRGGNLNVLMHAEKPKDTFPHNEYDSWKSEEE